MTVLLQRKRCAPGCRCWRVGKPAPGACSNAATAEYGTGGNQTPTADFAFSCSELTCDFIDQSTGDGSIVERLWNFGDSGTSTAQHPSHTYDAKGSYMVSLTVTDDRCAMDSASQTVTVGEALPGGGITLTVTGRKEKGLRYADRSWSGGSDGDVVIRRDGIVIATTSNDGAHVDDLDRGGGESFTYDTECSNPATVTF